MFYSVKLKVELDSGKKVKQQYLVEATSVTEAEVIAAKEFAQDGLTYTVSDINETNFKGVLGYKE